MKTLEKDFVDRLKKTFLSQSINEIVFGLDVFDDMSDDEYLVFKTVYNRYNDKHRTSD